MDEMPDNNKLRILLLARVFPPRTGGIEKYIYTIYRKIIPEYDVRVITPKIPNSREFDDQQSFKIIRSIRLPIVKERFQTPLIGMFISAIREVFRFRPHQIHCDQVYSGFVGKMITTFLSKVCLIYTYGMEITDAKLTRLKKWALNGNSIITISDHTHRNLVSHFDQNANCIYKVQPGVDPDIFCPGIDIKHVISRHVLEGKKVIMTVGRLSPEEKYKGHDRVIQAMPKILKDVPNAMYLIVGDGNDRLRLESLVFDLALKDKITFTGRIEDEYLPAYYNMCDVFVMVSREVQTRNGGTLGEGFGIVFLEANACGKPVVGGKSGGIEDAVSNGETGLLVDPNNVDEIAKAIIKILTNDSYAITLGKQGRKRVLNELTWDKAAEKVIQVVQYLDKENSNIE